MLSCFFILHVLQESIKRILYKFICSLLKNFSDQLVVVDDLLKMWYLCLLCFSLNYIKISQVLKLIFFMNISNLIFEHVQFWLKKLKIYLNWLFWNNWYIFIWFFSFWNLWIFDASKYFSLNCWWIFICINHFNMKHEIWRKWYLIEFHKMQEEWEKMMRWISKRDEKE